MMTPTLKLYYPGGELFPTRPDTKENNHQFDTECKTMLKSSSIKEDENKEENEHNGEEIRQKVDSSDSSLTDVSSYWPSELSVSSVGSSMDLWPRRPRPKSGLPTGGPTINSTALNYI